MIFYKTYASNAGSRSRLDKIFSGADKYNNNPAAESRLGAKHTEETKELFSKLRKDNLHFLNKTHSEEVIEEMRRRMTGSLNHMYGKPVTDENKKLISDLFRKDVYLYDANTLELIAKFSRHADLVKELKMFSKTLVKYKDSGVGYKDKCVFSSKGPEEIVVSKKEGGSYLNASVLSVARASFPGIPFDQLMSFCWTVLLPIIFAFIILVPCILYSFYIFPVNINLF